MSLLDPEAKCLFCDTVPDPHHIKPKGMGGTRNVEQLQDVVPLCRTCHRAIDDQGYHLERSVDSGITTFQFISPDGEIVAERRIKEGFDVPAWFSRLDHHNGRLVEMASEVVYLSHEELKAAAEQVKHFGRKAVWWWQANVLDTAIKRTAWGDKDKVVGELAQLMGIRKSTGWERVRTLDAFPNLSEQLENSMLTTSHFALAAHAPDPEEAIEQAEDKLAEQGRYPIAAMREDLGLGRERCPWWCEGDKCSRYEGGKA